MSKPVHLCIRLRITATSYDGANPAIEYASGVMRPDRAIETPMERGP